MKPLHLLLLLFIAAGCATVAPSTGAVAVIGRPADVDAFAGAWHGTIDFPDRPSEPVELRIEHAGRSVEGRLLLAEHSSHPRLLYLRLEGASVAAAALPEIDPACGCTVYTTVSGQLAGDVIRGEVRRVEDRTRVVVGTLALNREIQAR